MCRKVTRHWESCKMLQMAKATSAGGINTNSIHRSCRRNTQLHSGLNHPATKLPLLLQMNAVLRRLPSLFRATLAPRWASAPYRRRYGQKMMKSSLSQKTIIQRATAVLTMAWISSAIRQTTTHRHLGENSTLPDPCSNRSIQRQMKSFSRNATLSTAASSPPIISNKP